jgi:Zn ribbon nucleic-acid-binding protein
MGRLLVIDAAASGSVDKGIGALVDTIGYHMTGDQAKGPTRCAACLGTRLVRAWREDGTEIYNCRDCGASTMVQEGSAAIVAPPTREAPES